MEKYNLEQTGQEVQNILNEATPQSELTAETERAQLAEQQLQNDIDAIEEKIPSGASSSNKLATKEYVDDSVSTATATFRGTFNLVSDLGLTVDATEQQIAAALASEISTADNNDYCFVQIPTSAETPTEIEEIDRYKFNGTAWSFEYELNNSGFTADQWNAINSHITSGDVAKLLALPTNAELTILLNGKQDVLTFDNVPTENSNNPVKSSGVKSAIDDEETRAKAAEKQNADDIDSLEAAIEAILLLIPTAASSLNQLADKAFVNSSIATNTATFRGTFNLVNDLHLTLAATHAQVGNALALAILDSDNNDYCFVQIPTVETAPNEIAQTDRYKFNGSTWEYEYTLNNSGFTSAQWIAINSGITSVLVSKLSELPTNSELTSELGALTTAINNINLKIPAAAAQNNKLVDTAALESYIIQVLDVLTVSYTVESSDGHFTFSISQVDGKITSVEFTTSDVASQTELDALTIRVNEAEGTITVLGNRMTTAEGNISSLDGRMTTAELNITSLDGRVSTNETDIEDLKAAYAGLTQSDIIVGALPASGVENKIYRVPGTNSYSDYMWNGTQFVLMATYNNAIDPRPKKGSTNLVESGGVFDNIGALDISELNATENPHTIAKYVDLSAALAAVPTDYQKGGMSIKFVHISDNKYVQYRYMGTAVTGSPNPFLDTANWQGVDDQPTHDSKNLVESGGVYRTTPTISSSQKDSDLDVADEEGNVILRLEGGNVRTKNFDSKDVSRLKMEEDDFSDLDFSDDKGNVVLRVDGGHIKTKNFDSREINLADNNRLNIDMGLPMDIPKVYIESQLLSPDVTNNTISPLRVNGPGSTGNPVGSTETDDVVLRFVSNSINFTDNIQINYQGQYTLLDPKKNFSIDMANKHKFGKWMGFDSFHLKAFYHDFFNCRDWVCNRIMEQIYMTRNVSERKPFLKYNDFDDDERSFFASNALCHVDGFPCEVYINDVYWGFYIWRLKKHRNNYKFNKDDTNHVFLDPSDFYSAGGTFKWTGLEIRNPKKDSGNPDGFEEGVEPNAGPVKTIIETWRDFMWGITDNTPKEDIEQHIDMQEFIDVYLLLEVCNVFDSWSRNTLYGTWDGQHFAPMPYDMNNAFNGFNQRDSGPYVIYYPPTSNTYNEKARNMSWFRIIENKYSAEIRERYLYLNKIGIFTAENIFNLFEQFTIWSGNEAYEREAKRWPAIPSLIGDNMDKDELPIIDNWISQRISFINGKYKH